MTQYRMLKGDSLLLILGVVSDPALLNLTEVSK